MPSSTTSSTVTPAAPGRVSPGDDPTVLSVRPRVLLVEDDFIFRASLAELLMMEGYEVVCAADGAEALYRLAHDPPPTLMVLDIGLPRVDGVVLRTVQLRSQGLSDIPTIALTAIKDPQRLSPLGFHAVIQKGTGWEALLDAIRAAAPTRTGNG